MKFIVTPALVFLILSFAATLVLNFSSTLFLFSMLNTVILAVVVGSYRPSVEEGDGGWYSFQSWYEEVEDAYDKDEDYDSDDDDDYEKENDFSDGYDRDDEGDRDGEIGWEDDDEEEDDNLQRRIEEFIAKVNRGWRDEWLRENHQTQSKLG